MWEEMKPPDGKPPDPFGLMEWMKKLHTTAMGEERIRRNLQLSVDDVVLWCKGQIQQEEAIIERKGKNWYITIHGVMITVNASSGTIITAHKNQGKKPLSARENELLTARKKGK